MKKIFPVVVLLTIFLSFNITAFANNRSDISPKKRPFVVMWRGIKNLATFPAEFVSTAKREKTIHPKAWPISFVPRSLANLGIRLASGANDILILPLAAPFVEDISPITSHMELPDYPWQSEI